MDNIIGRKAKIIEDKEKLRHNGDDGIFIVDDRRLNPNLEDFAGMIGQVVGYNKAIDNRNYGYYAKGVIIVRVELSNGTITTIRADEANVELLD